MPVPRPTTAQLSFSRLAALAMFLVVGFLPCSARGPEPPLRLPLDPLGYHPPAAGLSLPRGSLVSVHFVDSHHLLLTFTVRRLMKRLPDCPPEDYDRMIQALLLDLPAGNVVGRTEWRVHDDGRYLWSIGNGRFILRNREQLSVIAPLAAANEDPFKQYPFLNFDRRRIDLILISPGNDLLTVESTERQQPLPDAAAQPFKAGPPQETPAPPRPPEKIQFFRIPAGAPPQPALSSNALARTPVDIPATGAGFMKVSSESRTRWLFDFVPYRGKPLELSPFDSSCRPHPIFVSNSEFIAIGCRGSNDSHNIGGFNMRGDQMWQQNFFESFAHLTLATAPAAGRFAISRALLLPGTTGEAELLTPDQVTGQEVRVYQTDSGDVILRAQCTPIQRAGQNFDLSPDGLALALIHEGAVEIYRLPGLTSKQQEAVKRAQASAPEPTLATVRLSASAPAESTAKDEADRPPATPPAAGQTPPDTPATTSATSAAALSPPASSLPASTTPADPQQAAPTEATSTHASPTQGTPSGDPAPDGPRKAPTLYAPNEKPALPTGSSTPR